MVAGRDKNAIDFLMRARRHGCAWVAVTLNQIEAFSLPTRPTKKTDTRSKNFEGESVEVDAISPQDLRAICESCITRHIDEDALAVVEQAEASERNWLLQLAERGVA